METVSLVRVAAAVTVGGVCMWLLHRRKCLSSAQRLVAITGCDSGVGYSVALHCHTQGFSVLAMVLSMDSSGAQALTELSKVSRHMVVVCVDVTNTEQVSAAVQQAYNFLENNKSVVFHGLINNAGVMVFGETEWQTDHIVSLQLEVNLIGAIRIARLFAPLLRAYKGRMVNVSSHCASLPLPGLAVYAASKAGLQAWSDALRVEWAKYGITVISLIPGAFFQQTNIMSRQLQYAQEMQEAMTTEAAEFYGQYYQQYQQYLSGLAGDKPATMIQNEELYSMLNSSLLDPCPRSHYHNTPWRYRLYHSLATVTPTYLRDWLVTKFTAMPTFKTS